MVAKLDSYMASSPDDFTTTEQYNVFIESLADYFRNDVGARYVIIDPTVGYLYRFDLTGFLLANDVPLEDHRLVMRMNGMSSIHDMDDTKTSLLVPDQATVARMKQIYRTTLSV